MHRKTGAQEVSQEIEVKPTLAEPELPMVEPHTRRSISEATTP